MTWPGSADGVRAALTDLHAGWAAVLTALDDAALDAPFGWPWPEPRPFGYAAAVDTNTELIKNIAEISVLRHAFESLTRGAATGGG